MLLLLAGKSRNQIAAEVLGGVLHPSYPDMSD